MTPLDTAKLADMKFWIMFDAMFAKGLLTYGDIQDAISRFRDMIGPDNPDYSIFKAEADRLERIYQPGTINQPMWPSADPS